MTVPGTRAGRPRFGHGRTGSHPRVARGEEQGPPPGETGILRTPFPSSGPSFVGAGPRSERWFDGPALPVARATTPVGGVVPGRRRGRRPRAGRPRAGAGGPERPAGRHLGSPRQLGPRRAAEAGGRGP